MGAYENPQYIGIKDPTAVTKIYRDSFQQMLVMMDKINTQKKAEKKERDKNIGYTTGSLLGSINKIHNTSDITKQNIQNNVNDFGAHATNTKFNNQQLTDAKFSWTNSVGAYNDLLNVAFHKEGVPDISKAHPQYKEFMELVDAIQGEHDFNNPYNKKTNTFDGSFTYTKGGETKTWSMHEISGILGSVAGGDKAFADWEKYYDNTILKNNSIIKVNASNMVNKIFNENGRAIPISDDDIDTVYDEVYSGLNLDIDDEREIWYNHMREGDKIFKYNDTEYKLDYNATAEHYKEMADKNDDGVLSEEESTIYNALNNAAGSLVKDFVKRQVVPSIKTKATAANKTLVPGTTKLKEQSVAYTVNQSIKGVYDSMPLISSSIDKMGPEELSVIEATEDMSFEEKMDKFSDYKAKAINDVLLDKDITFYGYNSALDAFKVNAKDDIENKNFDTSLEITKGTGGDAEKVAIHTLEGEELDTALTDLFLEKYGEKKYTGGKPRLFYTNKQNEVNVVEDENNALEMTRFILRVKKNATLEEYWNIHPDTYNVHYSSITTANAAKNIDRSDLNSL